MHKNFRASTILEFNCDGVVINRPEDIATGLNNYFVNVVEKLASLIPPVAKDFKSYLPD